MFFRERTKESPAFVRHLQASLLLATTAGALLGLLETAVVILNHLQGPVAFWQVGATVLATPPLLYAVVFAAAGLILGSILGIVPGTFPGRIRAGRSIVRLYTGIIYMPVTALALYLWWTRVPSGSTSTAGSALRLLGVAVVFYAGWRIARAILGFVRHRRATLLTRVLILFGVLLLFLAARGFLSFRGRRADTRWVGGGGIEPPLSLLLITMDTQRADFLRAYGDTLTVTPALDSLAAGGTLFLDACVPVPMTLPSHLSILTSTYPSVHGIRTNAEPRKLPATIRTLTEILRERGFRTGAFVSAFVLSSFTETSRGFEVYDDQFDEKGLHYLARIKPQPTLVTAMAWCGITLSRHFQRRAEATTDRAIGWLDRIRRDEPFFLWVHYYDPHSFYDPPAPYDALYAGEVPGTESAVRALMETARTYFPRQGDHVELGPEELTAARALYRGETTYMDHHLGRLIARLRELGRLDRTLVVATADHGEMLGEHGVMGHAMWVYRPLLHVPLFFRCPGPVPAGVVRGETVRSLDIMPTILDILGVPIPAQAQGRSLVPLFTGTEATPRAACFETLKPDRPERRLAGCRLGPWKYVYAPWGTAEFLFDIERDPGETRNRLADEPAVASRLRAQAEAVLNAGETVERGEAIEMDEEALDALRALGYIR